MTLSRKETEMGRTRNDKVWKYFNRISPYQAQCNLCKAQITCKTTSSNLVRHLYTRHRLDASHAGASHYAFLRYIDKSLRSPRKVTRDNDDNSEAADEIAAKDDSSFVDPLGAIVKNEVEEAPPSAAEPLPILEEHPGLTSPTENYYSSNSDAELHTRQQQRECHNKDDEDFEMLRPSSEFQITSFESLSEPALCRAATKRSCDTPTNSGDTSNQNSSGGESTALRAKLLAEARYYNDLAALARAKRVTVELQNKKLRFELDNLLATKLNAKDC